MAASGWMKLLNVKLKHKTMKQASTMGERSSMANPIDTDRNTPKEQRAVTHLPPVPALLNENLPPCGPIVQVAYANVNSAIRSQWFQHEGQKSLEEITLAVHQDLIKQKWSREALDPWRCIGVFQYEIRWARYFIRESQNLDALTESEILEQHEDSQIPKELGLVCNKKYVLDLWEAWHREKRTIPQPLQETTRSNSVESLDSIASLDSVASLDSMESEYLSLSLLLENPDHSDE